MGKLSSFNRLGNLLMLRSHGDIGCITDDNVFQPDPDLAQALPTSPADFLREYATNTDDHRFRIGLIYQSRLPKQWGHETLLYTDTVVRALYPISGAAKHELTAFQLKKRENSIYYGMELLLEYALKDSPGVPIFVPVLFDRGTTLRDYAGWLRHTLDQEDPHTPVIEVLNLIGPVTASRRNSELYIALKERIHNALIRKDARKPLEMKIMESMRGRNGTSPGQPTPEPAATIVTADSALNADPNSLRWYNAALHDDTCQKLQAFLMRPREYVEVEQIKSFPRFRELTPNQQKELARSCPLYAAPPDSALLMRGTSDQWNLYLLSGDVQLVAEDGEKKTVSGETEKAGNAIAMLKPRKYSVTALTPVRFLWIHESIIAEIRQRQPGSGLELLS